MRIAYMLSSLGIGGAERQVVGLAERMASHGHEVALLVLVPRQAHEFPANVEVVRLGMSKSAQGVLEGLRRGRRFLIEFKPDVVHSHTFPANMAARTLHLTGAAPRVVSTIHNIYEGAWWRTLAYRLSDPLSIHTTAVSAAVADRYIRMGAVPRDKCSVITNGIALQVFESGREALVDHKAVCGEDTFVWLAAGRAVRAKDFENLLAAFRMVRLEMPRTTLWIAGEHEPARIEAEGVRWIGLRDDMAATISVADGFVLSSAWEGMPLVVGEAMAMEKPVVATDVGGVRELVGDDGVLVPAKDSQALAAGILKVMRMPAEERRAMGQSARMRIAGNFDIDAKTLEWETLYLELLNGDAEKSFVSRMVG